MSALKAIRFFIGKLPSFSAIGYNYRKRRWHHLRPDFTGQTWIVTGASGGIGATIAEVAAVSGARVITIARSFDKMKALKSRVEQRVHHRQNQRRPSSTVGTIIPVVADLSDMHAIAELLDQLARKVKVDVLINNVGILNNNYHLNPQGFEQSYAVNLLGQFLLTEGLLRRDLMGAAPLIISMSSGGLYNLPLNLPFLNQQEEKFNGLLAYASHKRAQIALTDYWRRSWNKRELFAYTMHPGWVKTDGVKTSLPLFNKVLSPILRNTAQGADTALWLAQKRPTTRVNTVWFDRRQRSPYLFSDTKKPLVTIDNLVAALHADLQRINITPY